MKGSIEGKRIERLRREELSQIKQQKALEKHQDKVDTIIYEGYVIKTEGLFILISVNGEFISCRKGDTVFEKFLIFDADPEQLTVKIDGIEYKIDIKGDENE